MTALPDDVFYGLLIAAVITLATVLTLATETRRP